MVDGDWRGRGWGGGGQAEHRARLPEPPGPGGAGRSGPVRPRCAARCAAARCALRCCLPLCCAALRCWRHWPGLAWLRAAVHFAAVHWYAVVARSLHVFVTDAVPVPGMLTSRCLCLSVCLSAGAGILRPERRGVRQDDADAGSVGADPDKGQHRADRLGQRQPHRAGHAGGDGQDAAARLTILVVTAALLAAVPGCALWVCAFTCLYVFVWQHVLVERATRFGPPCTQNPHGSTFWLRERLHVEFL
eukprot:SAG22_NODE_863_length_6804_cov_3.086652_3_plen_247_part_00